MAVSRSIILILFCSLISAETSAGPSYALPSTGMLVAILMFLILVGLIVCRSVSWFVRLLLQEVLKERRKHLWIPTFSGMLLIVLLVFIQENFPFVPRPNGADTLVFVVMVFCPILGGLIGYFLSPIVKKGATNEEVEEV